MNFVFQGMDPYIRSVLRSHPEKPPNFYHQLAKMDAISRVGKALSQATLVPESFRGSVAGEALVLRDMLALALEVVESAVSETFCELELPAPLFLIEKEREVVESRHAPDISVLDPHDVELSLPPPRLRKK